jgi:hypothetical protein
MECRRGTFLILGFVVLLNCARFASAQTPSLPPQPVATLDLSESLPKESGEPRLTTIAFSSDNSIALGICRAADQGPKCSQYVVQWQNGSFNGIVQTQGSPRWGGRSSADGSRMLFDLEERKVPKFQHLLESLRTITTLGMSGPEDSNREVVRVIDTVTRKSCFEWNRSFPMRWNRGRFATISPSGALVAITVENRLSIYRLPPACKGSPKVRDK